jgi:hypothetical protein
MYNDLPGEVSEWLMVADSKSALAYTQRRFESSPLRMLLT